MKRKLLIIVGACLLMLPIGIWTYLRDPDRERAEAAYERIKPGMTREQVWDVMNKLRTSDSGYNLFIASDYWEIGGRYRIDVNFSPEYPVPPATVDEHDPNGDLWPVETKTLMDMKKKSDLGTLEMLLWRIGIPTRKRLFLRWER